MRVASLQGAIFSLYRFFSRLESDFGLDFRQEMQNFDRLFQKLRGDCGVGGALAARLGAAGEEGSQGPGEEGRDSAVSVMDGDGLVVDGCTAWGGSVAMALEKVACSSGRELAGCHTLLPHPLLEVVPGYELTGEEEEVAGEKEGGGGEGERHAPSVGLATPSLTMLQQDMEEEEEGEGEGAEKVQEVGVAGQSEGFSIPTVTGRVAHGSLLLHPACNVGKLLDPLDPAQSCDLPHPLLEASEGRPSEQSVTSYLDLCRQHLGFGDNECEFALGLYQRIQEAGEGGVEEAGLAESCHGDHTGGRSLQDHVTALLNFEMVDDHWDCHINNVKTLLPLRYIVWVWSKTSLSLTSTAAAGS